jgi:hypothetical protein
VWIFAEELSLIIERGEWGRFSMTEADATTDRILVTNIRARQLRQVVVLINDLLRKHYLHDNTSAKPVDPVRPM